MAIVDFVNKVEKIDQPLLVIGLGGTGFDAVMRIKKEFKERFIPEQMADRSYLDRPERTRFLVIDTDQGIAEKSMYGMKLDKEAEFCDISGTLADILASGLPGHVAEWYDKSLTQADINKNGAGVYRQVARLLLFSNVGRVKSKFESILSDLLSVNAQAGGTAVNGANIYMICGISGGTGSGTMLDVAYLLRHTIRSHAILRGYDRSIDINGMFVMPDVTISHLAQGNDVKRDMYSANSYAALKELDFWMNQPQHKQELTQRYADNIQFSWAWPPYKEVTMVCASNERGTGIRNPYNRALDIMAELLANIYSIEPPAVDFIGANAPFTYWAAIANNNAYLGQIPKPLPVAYCYNAIGAFSSSGDDEAIATLERQLIYADMNRTVLTNRPIMEGGAAPGEFFALAYGTHEATHRASFEKRLPLPQIFNDQPNCDIDSMRRSSPASAFHGEPYTTYAKKTTDSTGDEQRTFETLLWNDFVSAAREKLGDLKCGPEYLFTLLNTADSGYIATIESHIKELETKLTQPQQVVDKNTPPTGQDAEIQKKFNAFLSATRIMGVGGKAAFDGYRKTTKRLYAAKCATAYYSSLIMALKAHLPRVRMFTAILGDFTRVLRTQANLYAENINIETTLYDQGKVRESLTREYANAQVRDTIIHDMLTSIADELFVLTEQAGRIEMEKVGPFVDTNADMLAKQHFAELIDSKTLEQRMVAFGTNVGSVSEYAKVTLAPALDSGALVMLSPSPEFINLGPRQGARFSYVSVPSGAHNIYRGFHEYLQSKGDNQERNLRANSTTDSVFWVNSVFGLPLAAYVNLEGLKPRYNALKDSHKGMHLRMLRGAQGILESTDEVMDDWFMLPDPYINRSVFKVGKDEQILQRACQEGLIKITVNIDYNDMHTVLSEQWVFNSRQAEYITLREMQNRIADAKNGAATPQAYRDALMAIHGDQTRSELIIEDLRHKAEGWAIPLSKSGEYTQISFLTNRSIEPSMPANDQEAIREAWRVCYEKAVFEALSRRPTTVAAMRRNVECAALLNREIETAEQAIAALVFHDIRKAALLRIFDLVQLRPAAVLYRDLGGDWEHLGSENVLYALTDVEANAPLRERYSAFDRVDILLRFPLWFAAHAQEQITLGLVERLQAMRNQISRKAARDADTDAITSRAKEVVAQMKEMAVRLDHQYQMIGDEKSFDLYRRCIQETEDEMMSFLSIWDR